jgi:hypothetical protein
MRYDSIKHPFPHRMGIWSTRKTNDSQESQAKSLPCHVVKVEKDFIHVQFETNNSIFTMPTVKMTQGFSRFGREPTQVGDKGYAVPGGYYMGGVSAYAGGNTSFYPRANLSTLSFQPVANLKAPKRDYDQHHETGGPNGWIVKTMEKQEEDNQGSQSPGQTGSSGSGSSGTSTAAFRTNMRLMEQRNFMTARGLLAKGLSDVAGGLGGLGGAGGSSSGSDSSGSGSQQDNDKTQFSFDKDGLATIQSKDSSHLITVDGKNKQITLQVPSDETIYVGGDGKTGKYAKIATVGGPMINAQGRIG